MEEKQKRRTGRYPKNNKRTHCVMVRFDDVEWAKFLTLYEQSGVYAKAVFVKSRVFGETFKVVKVDKTMVDFYEKLSSFHAQFRTQKGRYFLCMNTALCARNGMRCNISMCFST